MIWKVIVFILFNLKYIDISYGLDPSSSALLDSNVCKSSQCYSTAARLLSLMNMTVDPCEDFYSYACGGIDSPTLLENDLTVDIWNRMEFAVKNVSSDSPIAHKKFQKYYEGCVHYEDLVLMEERKQQGKEILDSISTFFRLGDDNLPSGAISDLLIKLFQHGSAPLFDLQLDVDSVNSSKFQVVVTPSPMLFSGSHFFTAEEKSERCRHKTGDHIDYDTDKVYADYLDCLDNLSEFVNVTRTALRFFGIFEDVLEVESEKLIQDILISTELEIFNLKKGFTAKEFVNATQFKNVKFTHKKTLGDPTAPDYISEVNWDNLFLSLLKVKVTDDVPVQVYFLEKIQQMFVGLDDPARQRQMHNALLAVFAHDLYQEMVVPHHSCDRERYCLRVAASLMPAVAANLYMGTFPLPVVRKLRSQVMMVCSELVAAIQKNLEHADWMDETTFWEVKKKIFSLSVRWPEMLNETLIAKNLEKCPLDKRHYLQDSVCLVRLFQEELYSRYTMDPHSAYPMWLHFSKQFSTKPTFVYGLNTFLVPLAVMSPAYDLQMPYHVKAARLGNLLARGLGQCFDRTGVKFAATGRFGHILSENSNPSYDQVIQDTLYDELRPVFEDGIQYTYKPDPALTLNSRLSDITAANLSLSIVPENDTSLPWVPFSSKQIYFIASAQEFCSKKKLAEMIPSMFEGSLLPKHRVENIVRNSEQFDKVFLCPESSTMNKVQGTKIKPFPLYNEDGDLTLS